MVAMRRQTGSRYGGMLVGEQEGGNVEVPQYLHVSLAQSPAGWVHTADRCDVW